MHSWICKVYAKFVFGFECAAIGCSPECNELQERRKRHHTFFFRKYLQVNSANDFERSVAARAVSPFAWFMEPRSSCKFFLQKKCGASFCGLAISVIWDLCIWQHKSSLDMMINDYPFFSTNMSRKLIRSRPLDTQMMWNPYRMERFPPIPAPSPKNKMIPK